jgi:hypothetical protein
MTRVRNALIVLSRFGITARAAADRDSDALLLRPARSQGKRSVASTRSGATQRSIVLRAVFGNAFLALPRFTMADSTELTKSLAASAALQAAIRLRCIRGSSKWQRVREPLSRLGASSAGG